MKKLLLILLSLFFVFSLAYSDDLFEDEPGLEEGAEPVELTEEQKAANEAYMKRLNEIYECRQMVDDAKKMIDEKKYEKAIELIDNSLKVEQGNEQAWYFKAIALYNLKFMDWALECTDRAIALNRNSDAWGLKLQILNEQDRLKEAIAALDELLVMYPKDPNVWLYKGSLCQVIGDYPDAIACFTEVIKLDPKNPVAWDGKAVSLVEMGYNKEALECANKAIELQPQVSGFFNNRGHIYMMSGDYQKALEDCDKAVSLDPLSDIPYVTRGETLWRIKEFKRSIDDFKKAIELGFEEGPDLLEKVVAEMKKDNEEERKEKLMEENKIYWMYQLSSL